MTHLHFRRCRPHGSCERFLQFYPGGLSWKFPNSRQLPRCWESKHNGHHPLDHLDGSLRVPPPRSAPLPLRSPGSRGQHRLHLDDVHQRQGHPLPQVQYTQQLRVGANVALVRFNSCYHINLQILARKWPHLYFTSKSS